MFFLLLLADILLKNVTQGYLKLGFEGDGDGFFQQGIKLNSSTMEYPFIASPQVSSMSINYANKITNKVSMPQFMTNFRFNRKISTQQIGGFLISAHLVSEKLHRGEMVEVIFHVEKPPKMVKHLNRYGVSNKQFHPVKLPHSKHFLCLLAYVRSRKYTKAFNSCCSINTKKETVCLAQVEVGLDWWPDDFYFNEFDDGSIWNDAEHKNDWINARSKSFEVKFSMMQSECPDDLKIVKRPKFFIGNVTFLPDATKYEMTKEDQNILIGVPKGLFHRNNVFRVPVNLYDSQLTEFRIRIYSKRPGISLLSLEPNKSLKDTWNFSFENNFSVKKITAWVIYAKATENYTDHEDHSNKMLKLFSVVFKIQDNYSQYTNKVVLPSKIDYNMTHTHREINNGITVKMVLEPDKVHNIVPIIKSKELVNMMMLTGRLSHYPMSVYMVMHPDVIKDITNQANCSSTDESVALVDTHCKFIEFGDRSLKGSDEFEVEIKYGRFTRRLVLQVWVPQRKLDVVLSDYKLEMIDGWKVSKYFDISKVIKNKVGGVENTDNKQETVISFERPSVQVEEKEKDEIYEIGNIKYDYDEDSIGFTSKGGHIELTKDENKANEDINKLDTLNNVSQPTHSLPHTASTVVSTTHQYMPSHSSPQTSVFTKPSVSTTTSTTSTQGDLLDYTTHELSNSTVAKTEEFNAGTKLSRKRRRLKREKKLRYPKPCPYRYQSARVEVYCYFITSNNTNLTQAFLVTDLMKYRLEVGNSSVGELVDYGGEVVLEGRRKGVSFVQVRSIEGQVLGLKEFQVSNEVVKVVDMKARIVTKVNATVEEFQMYRNALKEPSLRVTLHHQFSSNHRTGIIDAELLFSDNGSLPLHLMEAGSFHLQIDIKNTTSPTDFLHDSTYYNNIDTYDYYDDDDDDDDDDHDSIFNNMIRKKRSKNHWSLFDTNIEVVPANNNSHNEFTSKPFFLPSLKVVMALNDRLAGPLYAHVSLFVDSSCRVQPYHHNRFPLATAKIPLIVLFGNDSTLSHMRKHHFEKPVREEKSGSKLGHDYTFEHRSHNNPPHNTYYQKIHNISTLEMIMLFAVVIFCIIVAVLLLHWVVGTARKRRPLKVKDSGESACGVENDWVWIGQKTLEKNAVQTTCLATLMPDEDFHSSLLSPSNDNIRSSFGKMASSSANLVNNDVYKNASFYVNSSSMVRPFSESPPPLPPRQWKSNLNINKVNGTSDVRDDGVRRLRHRSEKKRKTLSTAEDFKIPFPPRPNRLPSSSSSSHLINNNFFSNHHNDTIQEGEYIINAGADTKLLSMHPTNHQISTNNHQINANHHYNNFYTSVMPPHNYFGGGAYPGEVLTNEISASDASNMQSEIWLKKPLNNDTKKLIRYIDNSAVNSEFESDSPAINKYLNKLKETST